MNDDKALKAREDELIENLNFFLRNYNGDAHRVFLFNIH